MKIKWKVQEEQTGLYSAFNKRGWPTADYSNGDAAAIIYCDDEYIPRNVKSGTHGLLRIRVADHSVKPFIWKKVVLQYPTLVEAKTAVDRILKQHPEFAPKEKIDE
jgi:hypothetical protein